MNNDTSLSVNVGASTSASNADRLSAFKPGQSASAEPVLGVRRRKFRGRHKIDHQSRFHRINPALAKHRAEGVKSRCYMQCAVCGRQVFERNDDGSFELNEDIGWRNVGAWRILCCTKHANVAVTATLNGRARFHEVSP